KQLRGESMADVIFNGTTNRKPVGQASVELFFDNTETMLTGEYAKYSEIAIRREVNRDGMSNYYLNGSRCRRKDIVDIFLGTGLGPRSYAIIEQGMISQLIEAKPEELRVYLEEAAGISKYKERRRETENRIRHTRDNLERLNDIREELASQLRHLKRQANAANRYKQFKEEQRKLRAELQALHWRTVNDEMQQQETKLKEQELQLEAKQTEIGSVTTAIEKLREEQTELSDVFNEVQGRYYRSGSEVGRLEQQIQHSKERCTELANDLTEIDSAWREAKQHIDNDKHTINKLTLELQESDPNIIAAKEEANKAGVELTNAEQTMQEWQIAWESFTNDAAQSIKQAEVEETRIGHLEQRIAQEQQRLEKLKSEQAELPDLDGLVTAISALEAECSQTKEQIATLKLQLQSKQEQINGKGQQVENLTAELNQARHEQQELNGRRVSLEVLQQAALGHDNEQVNSWLKERQLSDNLRLAQDLTVTPGWEKAVETVLSSHLEAVCIDDLTTVADSFGSLANANITLLAKGLGAAENANINNLTLASKVESNWPVAELLSHIYIAETLAAALQQQQSLAPHESVVTQDGIWLGANWISVNFVNNDEKSGVLKRQRDLAELTEQLKTIETALQAREQGLMQAKAELTTLQQDSSQLQRELTELGAAYSDQYGALNAKQTQLEHLQQRAERIAQEITEYQQRVTASTEQLTEVRAIWQQAEESKLSDTERRTALLIRRDGIKAHLLAVNDTAKEARKRVDELTMQTDFARKQLQYLTQNLERSEGQIANLHERKQTIQQSLHNTESPMAELNIELEQALQKRLAVENELQTAKQNLESSEHKLRETEHQQTALQNVAQTIRDQLERLRMDWKALQVRCSTYEEQISESEFALEALLAELAVESNLQDWDEKLAHISKRIERLGPINLAAIDEYEQKQERKSYLDAQNNDLEEALTILLDAMHKIDRETRARFKNTFEMVNSKFSELFPIVFGGGKAYLELTGDDLLNTGVEILAQPPGKRNATIHLLSGGEKALTAVALVFAIFQLNPAPFCMLDEVDAPLDDNNVIRFCKLVTEMSETVQFLFVTHNKITMEMGEQLSGITMQEPGVSRIVSVDIQAAVDLAAN
ncbi:MAG: chromosome segregation protein SMC, partial [Gammaproteobacteria bacterium]|nr:chromosome segregation protein SMC [Gammaproteobacteria bacterium]